MIESVRYVRKPLYVEAVKVTQENIEEVCVWCNGKIYDPPEAEPYIKVRTHNPKSTRQTQAFLGDWVLYSDRGYKVYTPKAFENSFDSINYEGRWPEGGLPTAQEILDAGYFDPSKDSTESQTIEEA